MCSPCKVTTSTWGAATWMKAMEGTEKRQIRREEESASRGLDIECASLKNVKHFVLTKTSHVAFTRTSQCGNAVHFFKIIWEFHYWLLRIPNAANGTPRARARDMLTNLAQEGRSQELQLCFVNVTITISLKKYFSDVFLKMIVAFICWGKKKSLMVKRLVSLANMHSNYGQNMFC